MATNRLHAFNILEKLTVDLDYSHEEILDYVIKNHLSGDDAQDAMKGFLDMKEIDENGEPLD
jgi:hypothetical protein